MSESVIPAALLRVLSEYKFVGHPLWRMVTERIVFASNWPFTRLYQRYQSTRRGPKAGGSLRPLLASGLASPRLLDDHHHRRPDQTSRQHRMRHLRQQHRHYRSPHRQLSHYQGHLTKTAQITPSSRKQLHRLLLQSLHVLRNQGSSRLSTRQDNQHSTSTSGWRMNTPLMRSTTPRMCTPPRTRSS